MAMNINYLTAYEWDATNQRKKRKKIAMLRSGLTTDEFKVGVPHQPLSDSGTFTYSHTWAYGSSITFSIVTPISVTIKLISFKAQISNDEYQSSFHYRYEWDWQEESSYSYIVENLSSSSAAQNFFRFDARGEIIFIKVIFKITATNSTNKQQYEYYVYGDWGRSDF